MEKLPAKFQRSISESDLSVPLSVSVTKVLTTGKQGRTNQTPVEDIISMSADENKSGDSPLSSYHSTDSSLSIIALERAVSAQPGVSHRNYLADDAEIGLSAPSLERAYTSSELVKLRANEMSTSPHLGKRLGANSTQYIEIESVTLPSTGIKYVEIDKNTHTVFSVEVRLSGRLQWIIEKRYSDFRDLHDRLKRTNTKVKQLHFPKRHMFRNRLQSVIEQRRHELEKYINSVLEIRPLLRVPLFNFLEVYAHMESYERKVMRHQKEKESERMKNLLTSDEIEDLTAAFQRLASSKFVYQGNTSGSSGNHSKSYQSSTVASPSKALSPLDSPSFSSRNSSDAHKGKPSTPLLVSRTSFRRDILGVFPDMPSGFGMRFMKAVSERSGTDVSVDEFLRAMAILKRGSMEDRLKLVYNMCDLDHAGKLQSNGLTNFLVAVHGRQILERHECRLIVSEAFEHGRVRLGLQDFIRVVFDLKVTSILLDWMKGFVDILCEAAHPRLLEAQEEFNPIIQQKILASETEFSVKEVALLQDAFNTYRTHSEENGKSSSDSLDIDAMMLDFQLDISEERFRKAFSSFGPRANGSDVDIFSFVHALSIACRGTTEEKAKFSFVLFSSAPNRAYLTRDDLYALFRLDLSQNSSLESRIADFIAHTSKSSTPWHSSSEKRKKSGIIQIAGLMSSNSVGTGVGVGGGNSKKPRVSGSQLGRFVDNVLLNNGSSSHDATLTLDQFTLWSIKENFEMALLSIIRQVVFVALGLVPTSKEEELLIAKSCYKRYDPLQLSEDEYWYLMERKWFEHWCKYIDFPLEEFIPKSSSHPDFSTLVGSSSSSSNLNQKSKDPPILDSEGNYLRPRCFNNYILMNSATTGSVSSPVRKKSEHRTLKSPEEIKLGKHFVILCEPLWLSLKAWYGGGPELKRQAVLKADGTSVILDIWETEVSDEDEEEYLEDESDDSIVPSSRASIRRPTLSLPQRLRSGGCTGLENLGNTCYMNSALQCLTHTQLLAEYFLTGMYFDDINRTSTLGLQGKLAEVYGKLAEDMWCSKQKAISPREFKKTIGKFNEAFRGNDQQDAQELLAFLLSGLSEDLNRIQDKPYVEQPDSDGRFDSDLADEWWRNHLRREVSIIVALFTGQYKSLLTCSRCRFKSARFEPFTFLQVPLPEPTHNNITILLVMAADLPPMRVSVRLGITATVYDLKHELKKICNSYDAEQRVSESDINIAEYSGSTILGFKADTRRVAQLRSIDRLIAFQVEPLSPEVSRATRNWRSPHNAGLASGVQGNDIEELELDKHRNQNLLLGKLQRGTLVEVKTKSQSVEYVPGMIVDIIGSAMDEHKQAQVSVRIQEGEDPIKVSLSRIRLRPPRLLYLPLFSRKLSYYAVHFKNPFRPVPFGLPHLLRICPEMFTGYDLYEMVWQRVKRILADDPVAKPPTLWENVSLVDEKLICRRIDEIFTAPPNASQCGFVLRRVDCKGYTDSRASWLVRSFGHTIPCSKEPLDLLEEEAVAIDWDLRVFQSRVNQDKMKHIDAHSSIDKNEAVDKGPVPLSHCLNSFTSEEKISEGYCSSCREHLEMTKKLEIWRLPPVMVIHLKRFQYTQTYRRKLGSLVEFPLRGLDLSACVAPQGELPERYPMKRPHSETNQDAEHPNRSQYSAESSLTPPNRSRRGYTNTNLDQSRGMETHYDLYGVVNHQGALGGGHYTAYAKSFVDKQWYFYDDERVRLIEESKVVTPSAYLLFYIRSDMKGVFVKDIYPQNSKGKITEEDINRFVEQGDERKCSVM